MGILNIYRLGFTDLGVILLFSDRVECASRFVETETSWCPPEMRCVMAASRAGNFVALYFRRLSPIKRDKRRFDAKVTANIERIDF